MNRLRPYLPALLIAMPLLAVAAFSSANGGFIASIANAGYGGQYNPTVTASSYTVAAGTNVDFNGRGFGTEETVTVTMNGSTVATAHADGGGNFSTGSITVPNTAGTYTYTFTGSMSGTPVSVTITVTGQNNSNPGNGTNPGNPTNPYQPTGPATISASSDSVRAGTSVDFNGRNFGVEEDVAVTMGGNTVAHPHADLGGNFSTGSVSVPSTPGSYTYTFTGTKSGTTLSKTITVTE